MNNQNRIILSAIGNLSDEELVEIMEAVVYEWRARLNELLPEDNEKDESGRDPIGMEVCVEPISTFVETF